ATGSLLPKPVRGRRAGPRNSPIDAYAWLLSLGRCCCCYEITLLLVRLSPCLSIRSRASCRFPGGGAAVIRQHLGDLDPLPALRRQDAGAHHRERARRILAAHLRRPLAARRRCELLELLDERIVAGERNRRCRVAAAPEHAHAAMLVVE